MRIVALLVMVASSACVGAGHSSSTDPARSPLPRPLASLLASYAPVTDAELKASAEQFVRDYYAAVNASIASSDSSSLVALSTPSCACRRLVELIDRFKTQAKYTDPVRFKLLMVEAHVESNHKSVVVDLTYDIGEEVVRDSHGRITRRIPAERGTQASMTLVSHEGRWLVSNTTMIRRGTA